MQASFSLHVASFTAQGSFSCCFSVQVSFSLQLTSRFSRVSRAPLLLRHRQSLALREITLVAKLPLTAVPAQTLVGALRPAMGKGRTKGGKAQKGKAQKGKGRRHSDAAWQHAQEVKEGLGPSWSTRDWRLWRPTPKPWLQPTSLRFPKT